MKVLAILILALTMSALVFDCVESNAILSKWNFYGKLLGNAFVNVLGREGPSRFTKEQLDALRMNFIRTGNSRRTKLSLDKVCCTLG